MKPIAADTPSQTVGPYFTMALAREGENQVAGCPDDERAIRVEGYVLDGGGARIEDALVELWQADAKGRYAQPTPPGQRSGFRGVGRSATDFRTGLWHFDTIVPGRVPASSGALQAPHLSLIVQGRGMLKPVFTRMYFPEHATEHGHDDALSRVPVHRRHTLIASRVREVMRPTYRFDITMQGENETVFFDV